MKLNDVRVLEQSAMAPQAPRPLTERQLFVLDRIELYIRTEGCAPTLRELAGLLEMHLSVVREHVRALFRKGVLIAKRTDDGRVIARRWTVVRPA